MNEWMNEWKKVQWLISHAVSMTSMTKVDVSWWADTESSFTGVTTAAAWLARQVSTRRDR